MSSNNLKALAYEATILAEIVNTARFEGTIPAADITVRLTEVTDMIFAIVQENV